MSTPSPAPHRPSFNLTAWRPSRRALWWILAAFVVGLGLFALVWSGDRNRDDFYRVGDTPPTAAAPDYEPLPTPLPAREGDASGLPPAQQIAESGDAADPDEPRLVEPAPAPVASAAPPVAETAVASTQARPIDGRTPAPRYPTRALRRGDRGTVMVRASIGPDGVPTSVSVVDGSGSRLLDRAALEAVQQWRFHPATQNGSPTVGTVMVPISFEPAGRR